MNAQRTTTAQQLASIERELAMRVKVYARSVADRRMDLTTAQHEVACMEDLWLRLRATSEGEADAPLQLVDLFAVESDEHPWSTRLIGALPPHLHPQPQSALL